MELKEIEVEKLIERKEQNSRTEVDEVDQLMRSIEQHGLLQPIGVNKEGSSFVVVYGHRRLNAVKKLGKKKIAAYVLEGEMDKNKYLELNVTENIQRKELAPVELGRICFFWKNEKSMSLSEIAAKLNIPKNTVKSSIETFKGVPEKWADRVKFKGKENKQLGIGTTIANTIGRLVRIGKIESEDTDELFETALKEELTSSEVTLISELIHRGYTVHEAIKGRDDYICCSPNGFVLNKAIWKATEKKENLPFGLFVYKLLSKYDKRLVPEFKGKETRGRPVLER